MGFIVVYIPQEKNKILEAHFIFTASLGGTYSTDEESKVQTDFQ